MNSESDQRNQIAGEFPGHAPSNSGAANVLPENLVLAVVIVCLIVLFAVTQYLVSIHREKEASLAKTWFARGDAAMAAKSPAIAAEDYRNALSYDPENGTYRLRLAEALLADHRYPEAQSHLFSLWEADPASGEINLALAHLQASQGHFAEAVRYYRNAINGVWVEDPRKRRDATRFELVHYLLHIGDMQQATVELIALQADPPVDVPGTLEMANLLLQVRETGRAKTAYESILKNDPKNVAALIGIGQALFSIGDFAGADGAYSAALSLQPTEPDVRAKLQLVREVLAVAPGLRGLPVAARAQRASLAYQSAVDRLGACAAQKDYALAGQTKPLSSHDQDASSETPNPAPQPLQTLFEQAQQWKANSSQQRLRQHPDSIEPLVELVFAIETTTQNYCPAVDLQDRALLTLAIRQPNTVQ